MNLKNRRPSLKYILLSIATLFLLLFYFLPNINSPSIKKLNNQTFSKLRKIKQNKEDAILNYLNNATQNARGITEDKLMLDYFFSNCDNKKTKTNIASKLDHHFVHTYYNYFDILFIDKNGFIFNSIRHEEDFNKNLFEGELSKTFLSKKLTENRDAKFVDYEYYFPSEEFSAFFPVSIEKENVFYGWIVLQLPLNAINTILLDRTDLGKTGEVYLVNENKQLLTKSRFIEDASLQKIRINTTAVSKALNNISDDEIIKDYRGISVFSAFSKMKFLGTSLIIIAEIDEDEELTNYYLDNSDYYAEKIVEYYEKRKIRDINYCADSISLKRVDVSEYSKSNGNEVLFTKGVSTCSAAILYLPNQFGYLSHISPLDKTYSSNYFVEKITSLSLKHLFNRNTTDFLKEITNRIAYYEIIPSQLYDLELVFVANHRESYSRAIKEVVSEGLNVSKIRFMYNSTARSENTYFNLKNEEVIVEWIYDGKQIFESSKDIKSIGEIIKEIN